MAGEDQLLARLVEEQRRGMRYQVNFSIAIFVLGLVVMIAGLILPAPQNPEIPKELVTLGGAFVSSLTAIPIKDILARREKLATLCGLNDLRAKMTDDDRAKVDQLTWKMVEKIVAG